MPCRSTHHFKLSPAPLPPMIINLVFSPPLNLVLHKKYGGYIFKSDVNQITLRELPPPKPEKPGRFVQQMFPSLIIQRD